MANRVSQAEWARRRGVSRQYVNRLVREGKLPADDHGRIDPDQADRILEAVREPARRSEAGGHRPPPVTEPEPRTPAGPVDLPTLLLRTRIKSEAERARLLEIKAKVEAGRFVDVDEVKVEAFNKGRAVRDALLNLPHRLAPLLAAEGDARACFAMLDAELRQALIELTGGPETE